MNNLNAVIERDSVHKHIVCNRKNIVWVLLELRAMSRLEVFTLVLTSTELKNSSSTSVISIKLGMIYAMAPGEHETDGQISLPSFHTHKLQRQTTTKKDNLDPRIRCSFSSSCPLSTAKLKTMNWRAYWWSQTWFVASVSVSLAALFIEWNRQVIVVSQQYFQYFKVAR